MSQPDDGRSALDHMADRAPERQPTAQAVALAMDTDVTAARKPGRGPAVLIALRAMGGLVAVFARARPAR